MMEKPIERKEENQIKIIKIESEAAVKATPLIPPPEQKEENQAKIAKNESKSNSNSKSKPLIWDCGSSLYDSFELKSFERQLDSAINSRTLSMPHLADRRVIYQHHPPPPPPPSQPPMSKKSSKISRSFHKLLRSVFKPKAQNDTTGNNNNNNSPFYKAKEQQARQDGFYVLHDRSRVLSTIPEVPEFHALSPEIKSLVRRTASDRFTATSIGISCA